MGYVFLAVIVIYGINRMLNLVDWSIVAPLVIVILVGYIVYRMEQKRKHEEFESQYEKVSNHEWNETLDDISLEGTFKCSSCGGFSPVKLSDKDYKCIFCGAHLYEADKKAETLRDELRKKKAVELEQAEKDRAIKLKELEIEKEKWESKAKDREARRNILQVVLPILGFALVILFMYLGISGTFGSLFASITELLRIHK